MIGSSEFDEFTDASELAWLYQNINHFKALSLYELLSHRCRGGTQVSEAIDDLGLGSAIECCSIGVMHSLEDRVLENPEEYSRLVDADKETAKFIGKTLESDIIRDAMIWVIDCSSIEQTEVISLNTGKGISDE